MPAASFTPPTGARAAAARARRPGAGFAPLGALAEAGATGYRWPLGDRDRLWADDVGELIEQASAPAVGRVARHPLGGGARAARRPRARGRPGDDVHRPERVRRPLRPRRLPAERQPALAELLLWLASHVHDEARHVEVFTKRSLVGGQAGYALASTELSLHTLLEERDFTASSLLLNVLGEGTFLDLLRFV